MEPVILRGAGATTTVAVPPLLRRRGGRRTATGGRGGRDQPGGRRGSRLGGRRLGGRRRRRGHAAGHVDRVVHSVVDVDRERLGAFTSATHQEGGPTVAAGHRRVVAEHP